MVHWLKVYGLVLLEVGGILGNLENNGGMGFYLREIKVYFWRKRCVFGEKGVFL